MFRQVIPCYRKMDHFHSKPDSFPLLVSPVRSSLSSSLIPRSFISPIQIVIGKINGGREKLLFWWWHLWDKQKISKAANTKLILFFDPNLQSSFTFFSSFSFTHSLTFLLYGTLNFYIGYSCAGLACVSSLFELSYHTSWQNINLQLSHRPKKKKDGEKKFS